MWRPDPILKTIGEVETINQKLREENARLRQRVQELEQALKQYLGEYDAPAPDLTLRVQYRKALAAALAAAKGKP